MKIIDEYIEKRLDRYYTKKCAEQIYSILKYDMKIKYTKQKNCYLVEIKKQNADSKSYKVFYRIYYDDGLETFIRFYNANKKKIVEEACKLLGDE